MAANEKIINTKLKLRYDSHEEWIAKDPVLLEGEVALSTVSVKQDDNVNFVPSVLIKVGDGTHKYSELEFVYAKAADVVAAAKSETALTAYINNVITEAGLASAGDLSNLTNRVSATEGEITTLKGDAATAGSVAKAIKDAIDALDLANTYEAKGEAAKVQGSLDSYKEEVSGALEDKVAKEPGKSLVADTEITKLAGVSEGANKVEASETNGKIKIDGVETTVYTHPEKHTSTDISDFNTAVAAVKVDNAAKADEATKATQDGNGDVIVDTYAKKATTLAGYNIGDAYTKEEVHSEIEGAINTFVGAYITSDGGAIDKLQEIADWIDSDKDGAADIIADVEANASGIESLGGRVDTIEDTLETHGDIVTHNVSEFYTREQADAAFTDSTEVDGQIDAKIDALKLGETYEPIGAEGRAIAAAEGKVNELANGAVKTNTEAIAAINEELDTHGDIVTHNIAEFATAEQGGKADSAVQTISTPAGTDGEPNGLKAVKTGTDVAISIDESVVFVFDCGNAGGWL